MPGSQREEAAASQSLAQKIASRYEEEQRKVASQLPEAASTDVDGWSLDRSQLDLVSELQKDLRELHVLLICSEREDNRARLKRAIRELEVKLRIKRTWAFFPLTEYSWAGHEFASPVITLDFKVPGAGSLPAEDVHCSFGKDSFDLTVWNVAYQEDPGVKYHHRVRMTRLMRNIIPSKSSVRTAGDHLLVNLHKVYDERHGYCAWPQLVAGKGRKPFQFKEDAPDGGLMDFLEGEYEKHEGFDGFRREIGKAMEQVHRCEPVRGVPEGPDDEWG